MIANSFGWLLAGLLLVFLDFRINGIDVLPDFLGFAAIAFAAWSLGQGWPSFYLAGACAAAGATLDVATMLFPHTFIAMVGQFLNLVAALVILALLTGYIAVSETAKRPDLVRWNERLRIAYAILTVVGILLPPAFVLTLGRGASPFYAVVAIVGMCLTATVIYTTWVVRRAV